MSVLDIHDVDQAGLELKDPLAYVSQMLGLKMCAATSGLVLILAQTEGLGTVQRACLEAKPEP